MGNNPINGVDPDGGCWTTDSEGNSVPCPDGNIEDTMVGNQGATWTYGQNGWYTNAFDANAVDLGTFHTFKDTSFYEYSKEVIPGKFESDINFIFKGNGGNWFSRFVKGFSRDWDANTSEQCKDFMVDVATSIIPGGVIVEGIIRGTKITLRGGKTIIGPILDASCKLHGKLPTRGEWTKYLKEALDELVYNLKMSMPKRTRVNKVYEDVHKLPSYNKRVNEEQQLLRDIENYINGK